MNALSPASPRSKRQAARPAPELSVVVPTFKERDNVPLLVEKLARTLAGIDWEVIFVDDNSPDGTAAVVRAIGETDARVRCIRRIGRRGLAGACIEGMLASQARYVAVMDADLQHDETLLAAMLAQLRGGDADLAVASRYVDGGSAAGLRSARREQASRLSTAVARRLLGVDAERPDERLLHDAARRASRRWRRSSPRRASRSCSTSSRRRADDCASSNCRSCSRERQHGESKLDTRSRSISRRCWSRSSPATRCRSASCCSAWSG